MFNQSTCNCAAAPVSAYGLRWAARVGDLTQPRIGAVILYPSDNASGNLIWAVALPQEHLDALPGSLEALRALGYLASAFPEGDGVTFNSASGARIDPGRVLEDFRTCLPQLEIGPLAPGQSTAERLAELSGDAITRCTYLAPVEAMRPDSHLAYGATVIHRPVDGDEITLASHRWQELCDVPGADVRPEWAPGDHATGTTRLLGLPLIEREIDIPVALLHRAKGSVRGQEELLRFVLEDADRALDPLRFDICSYHKPSTCPCSRDGSRTALRSTSCHPAHRSSAVKCPPSHMCFVSRTIGSGWRSRPR